MLVATIELIVISNAIALPFPHVLLGVILSLPGVALLANVMLLLGVDVDAVNVAPVPE